MGLSLNAACGFRTGGNRYGARKIKSSIQLSFEEYVDVWENLAGEFFQRCISDDKFFDMLMFSEEMSARFSIELATVILIIAMLCWNEKQINDKIQNKVTEAVIQSFYEHLIPGAKKDMIKECVDFYHSKYSIFSEIFKSMDSESKEKRKTRSIGFARYLIAQVSPDDEQNNPKVIEHLSIRLSEAESAFARLTENSSLDVISVPGRPKFIVHQV